jgi:predicted deacylase
MKRTVAIGSVRAKPGELKRGNLAGVQLRDSTFAPLPLLVANGEMEGSTVTVISTIHGLEIAGIEVIRRVLREQIDLSNLAGTIIAVPVGNPLAFRHLSYVTPQYDFSNMQGSFPGSPKSSTTARITHQISELVLKSDYFIDLHCVPQFSTPWTIIKLGYAK